MSGKEFEQRPKEESQTSEMDIETAARIYTKIYTLLENSDFLAALASLKQDMDKLAATDIGSGEGDDRDRCIDPDNELYQSVQTRYRQIRATLGKIGILQSYLQIDHKYLQLFRRFNQELKELNERMTDIDNYKIKKQFMSISGKNQCGQEDSLDSPVSPELAKELKKQVKRLAQQRKKLYQWRIEQGIDQGDKVAESRRIDNQIAIIRANTELSAERKEKQIEFLNKLAARQLNQAIYAYTEINNQLPIYESTIKSLFSAVRKLIKQRQSAQPQRLKIEATILEISRLLTSEEEMRFFYLRYLPVTYTNIHPKCQVLNTYIWDLGGIVDELASIVDQLS